MRTNFALDSCSNYSSRGTVLLSSTNISIHLVATTIALLIPSSPPQLLQKKPPLAPSQQQPPSPPLQYHPTTTTNCNIQKLNSSFYTNTYRNVKATSTKLSPNMKATFSSCLQIWRKPTQICLHKEKKHTQMSEPGVIPTHIFWHGVSRATIAPQVPMQK